VPVAVLLATYATVGFTALLYEVAWTRALAVVLGSSIYAFSSMLGAFLTGIAAGQDFPIPFTNFQEFLSTAIAYNQAGTLSNGSDVNYLSVTAANTLNFFKMDPFAVQLLTRTRNRIDFPRGIYMLDFRDQPIATNQTGNMQVNLNASTAAAQSTVLVGWESFAFTNAVLGAASLPAG
jgi:hypothetical protein